MNYYKPELGRVTRNKRGTLNLLQQEAGKVRELLISEINQLIDVAEKGVMADEVRQWLQCSPRYQPTRREIFDFIYNKFKDAVHDEIDAYNLTFVINVWVYAGDLYVVPNTGNFTENWLDVNVDIEFEDFSFPMSDETYDVNDSAFRESMWKVLRVLEPLQLHVCSVERFHEFRSDCV